MNMNYSPTQTILAIVHLISPLILLFFIGDSLKDVAESFLGQLAIACLIIGIIFALITGGRTKQVKTGYSFKTKSGVRLDEYKDKEIPGIPISNLHAGIGLIHFVIPIIVFLFWVASTTK